MSRSLFAALACTGFFIEGVLTVAHREFALDGIAYDHLLDGAYAVAMIGCAVAVPAVATRVHAPRSGRIGARVATAGFAAMALESGVGAVHRLDALGPVFMLGIIAATLGCLLLGVAGGDGPRWIAVLPFVAMVLAAAGGEVGASLLSATAWALVIREHARDGQGHRVAVPHRASAAS